jgi:DNA-directed RNA polymerase alpha subunit
MKHLIELDDDELERWLRFKDSEKRVEIANSMIKSVRQLRQEWRTTELGRIEFTVRAANVLTRLGATTIADVQGMTDAQILDAPNCGKKTLCEIRIATKERA